MSSQSPLHDVRFAGERELLEALVKDERLSGPLSQASYDQHKKTVRMRLLATAVRVDPRMLPKLDASIHAVRARSHFAAQLEAYVFEDPAVNAFMTQGEKLTFLGLSSGAVNALSAPELEFLIGHELGHALFEHVDAQVVMQQEENLDTRTRQRLFAWKRASEISADRCGLVCCGSIEVAATATFRSLSGLSSPDLRIRPEDFTEQWDHLLAEVIRGGEDDVWQHTHPFPPLRMKAMVLFWQSDSPLLPDGRGVTLSTVQVDEEVARLLTTMDPLARERDDAADALLEDFVLWGGLCILCAGGTHDEAAKAKLQSLVAGGAVERGLSQAKDQEAILTRFKSAIGQRRKKLRALEINKILKGMLAVGYAKGHLTGEDVAAFNTVGSILGIEERACDLVRERFLEERS